MSKRFGRQQKKKLKAQVEALQICNDHEKSKIKHMNSELKFVDDVLGNISGLTQREVIQINNPRDFRSWQMYSPNQLMTDPYVGELMADSPEPYPTHFHAHIESIEPVKLEQVRDDIRNARHFYFTAGNGQWAYAASPEMLRLSGQKAMVRRISDELAGMIEEYMRTGQTFA